MKIKPKRDAFQKEVQHDSITTCIVLPTVPPVLPINAQDVKQILRKDLTSHSKAKCAGFSIQIAPNQAK